MFQPQFAKQTLVLIFPRSCYENDKSNNRYP